MKNCKCILGKPCQIWKSCGNQTAGASALKFCMKKCICAFRSYEAEFINMNTLSIIKVSFITVVFDDRVARKQMKMINI